MKIKENDVRSMIEIRNQRGTQFASTVMGMCRVLGGAASGVDGSRRIDTSVYRKRKRKRTESSCQALECRHILWSLFGWFSSHLRGMRVRKFLAGEGTLFTTDRVTNIPQFSKLVCNWNCSFSCRPLLKLSIGMTNHVFVSFCFGLGRVRSCLC